MGIRRVATTRRPPRVVTAPVELRKRHDLITVQDAQKHLRRAYDVEVPAATIRQWACRKKIGTYSFRRDRFDLREIEDHAREMGWIAK